MIINDSGIISEVILTEKEIKEQNKNLKLLGKLIKENKLEF